MSQPIHIDGEFDCPHCGEVYDADESDLYAVDEETVCEACGKSFLLTMTGATLWFQMSVKEEAAS